MQPWFETWDYLHISFDSKSGNVCGKAIISQKFQQNFSIDVETPKVENLVTMDFYMDSANQNFEKP